MCETSEGKELRDDALSNEVPQEKQEEEVCDCSNHVFREGVHLPGCHLHKPSIPPQELKEEDMSVEEMCRAAIAGKIKPSIDLLEKANGTPWELELKPDGTAQYKWNVMPCVGNDDFKEDCFALRAQIEETKIQTMLVFDNHPVFDSQETHGPGQFAEMLANLKLSFRHLEDARMRLGKAVQAFDGGTSCYPR